MCWQLLDFCEKALAVYSLNVANLEVITIRQRLFSISEHLKIKNMKKKCTNGVLHYLPGWRLSVPCWSHTGLCFLITQEMEQASKNCKILQGTGSQHSQSCDFWCTLRAWKKVTQETRVSCESLPNPLLPPFGCKNRAGGEMAYSMIAFQSSHKLNFTKAVTTRAGSGWGTEKILPWSEKELFGRMTLATSLFLRKNSWRHKKKG